MKPAELVRRGEEAFAAHYAGKVLSDDGWLDALVAHPILIERPIVVRGEGSNRSSAGEGAGLARRRRVNEVMRRILILLFTLVVVA